MTGEIPMVYVLSDHLQPPDSNALDYVVGVARTVGEVESALLERIDSVYEGEDDEFIHEVRASIIDCAEVMSSEEVPAGHYKIGDGQAIWFTVTAVSLA